MEHSYFIQTESLNLRPLMHEDLEMIRVWRNSDDINCWFVSKEKIKSNEQLSWYAKYLKTPGDFIFVIEEKIELCQPIGLVSLYNHDQSNKSAEFGRLMIGDNKARAKGYGLEATRGLCSFGFKELELIKIYLEVMQDNKAAISIYLKSGFLKSDHIVKDGIHLVRMELDQESVVGTN